MKEEAARTNEETTINPSSAERVQPFGELWGRLAANRLVSKIVYPFVGTTGKKVLRRVGVLPALVIVFAAGAIFVPGFSSSSTQLDTMAVASVIGLLAIGEAFVIIAGGAGIDLSVGSVPALCIVVGAGVASHGEVAIIAVALAVGLFMGLTNGIGVAISGMQPFVMTLATLTIAAGAAEYVTGAAEIPMTGSNSLPWLTSRWHGIPVPVILWVACVAIAQIVISRTVFGRQIYVLGGNEEAGRFAGIPVAARRIAVYAISGLCCAIAGMLLMSMLGTADPAFGNGYELNAIAGVVVGGAPLTGGQGSIMGAAVGVLIIQYITTMLGLLNVNSFLQQVVTGLIVIVVVGLNRRGREGGMRELLKVIPLAIIIGIGLILLFTVLHTGGGTL